MSEYCGNSDWRAAGSDWTELSQLLVAGKQSKAKTYRVVKRQESSPTRAHKSKISSVKFRNMQGQRETQMIKPNAGKQPEHKSKDTDELTPSEEEQTG